MSAFDRARDLRAARLAKRRESERADARDFLVNGDGDGRHAMTCVHAARCDHDAGCRREACAPCSRTYDPLPYPEAAPSPPHVYAGTGIGALYGLPALDVPREWQTSLLGELAGWNVAIPVEREVL